MTYTIETGTIMTEDLRDIEQAPPTGGTVLVIDDDRDILSLLSDALTMAGFDVLTASDGPSGLAEAKTSTPDLILLDWMMPGMSGLEVCSALRAEHSLDSMPVVMLTARAAEADVEWGYQAGVDDYVSKPFSPYELVKRVRTLLQRGRDAG